MKVFAIGLSKTGTTSLAKALNILGFRCAHYPLGAMTYRDPVPALTRLMNAFGYAFFNYPLGMRNLRLDHPMIDLSGFSQFEAFADIPIAYCYRELDRAFPGSKFILTVREVDRWLKSCRSHMGRPYRPGRPRWWIDEEMGRWQGDLSTNMINRLNHDLYGSTTYKEGIYRSAYDSFLESVKDYFVDRGGDLLVMDITAGEGWVPLCSFLNRPVPGLPFPVENVTKKPAGPA